MTAQPYIPWLIATAIALAVVYVQWRVMNLIHQRRLVQEQTRHQRAQRASAALLKGSREQTAALSRELAVAREACARVATTASSAPDSDGAAARERLHKMIDEAPQNELPADGFADTLPSRESDRSSFGLLQRSTAKAS
jgi:hypothetical protein